MHFLGVEDVSRDSASMLLWSLEGCSCCGEGQPNLEVVLSKAWKEKREQRTERLVRKRQLQSEPLGRGSEMFSSQYHFL